MSEWNIIVTPIWAKWGIGESVEKTKGSNWSGKVVGFYSTNLTDKGYAVESDTEKGSVQIYPESALRSKEVERELSEDELEEMTEYACDELFAVSAQECREDVAATVYAMLAGGYRKERP